MTFVFPVLLGGLALAGIPVLLHLIVRRKPKRLPFPAFRFLVQQQRSNLRKLRLRHLLLLALRVFLIVAMCLLLARPRLFQRVLGLDGERPVSAVFVLDTSASMEYQRSDGVSRLEEAVQNARNLLDELPAGSKVAIIDTADAKPDQAAEWLPLDKARQRLGELKIRYANASLAPALLRGLTIIDQPDPDKGGQSGPPRTRLLAVFSDRTRACWDGGQVPALLDKLDRIRPTYEGLSEARGKIGAIVDMLRDLRTQLPPPAGKDYAEQSLIEALTAMQSELAGLSPDADRWPDNLGPSVRQVRRLTRDLLGQLPTTEDAAKLRSALGELLRATGGVQMLFIDVGMESPVDLALTQIELPRNAQGIEQQLFAEKEAFTLQVTVQATGKAAPATVVCQVGDAKAKFDINEIKPGLREIVPFEIGGPSLPLKLGDNLIEVHLPGDRGLMPHGRHRFAAVQVQPKTKVLIVVDDVKRTDLFAKSIASLGYAPDVVLSKNLAKDALRRYAAIYMVGVAAPDAGLWDAFTGYVQAGGGLGIVPAGDEMEPDSYNSPAAQKLMPGTIERKVDGDPKVGSFWNWEGPSAKYQHSFMKRFKAWKEMPKTDFFEYPRGALYYWDVKRRDNSMVLVEYLEHDKKGRPLPKAAGKPAVLETALDAKSAGKVLLLTTPLDEQTPAWNNYAEELTSFYLALLMQATSYLAGESVPPQRNFILGRGDPVVTLIPGPAVASSSLRGPNVFKQLNLTPEDTQLTVRDIGTPGGFLIEGKTKETGELRRLAGFALNVPAEECDLNKVPAVEIEPLFPGEAVLAIRAEGSLHSALQVFRSEPFDLVPYFMIALLFALALENLLANKFYRQSEANG